MGMSEAKLLLFLCILEDNFELGSIYNSLVKRIGLGSYGNGEYRTQRVKCGRIRSFYGQAPEAPFIDLKSYQKINTFLQKVHAGMRGRNSV